VIVEREVDCGLIYQRFRRRLIATLRSLDSRRLGTVVPATAAWSVRDAVAHVVGIASNEASTGTTATASKSRPAVSPSATSASMSRSRSQVAVSLHTLTVARLSAHLSGSKRPPTLRAGDSLRRPHAGQEGCLMLNAAGTRLPSSFRHTTREIGSSTCQMLFCGGRNTW
jgi:hypothetical protein